MSAQEQKYKNIWSPNDPFELKLGKFALEESWVVFRGDRMWEIADFCINSTERPLLTIEYNENSKTKYLRNTDVFCLAWNGPENTHTLTLHKKRKFCKDIMQEFNLVVVKDNPAVERPRITCIKINPSEFPRERYLSYLEARHANHMEFKQVLRKRCGVSLDETKMREPTPAAP